MKKGMSKAKLKPTIGGKPMFPSDWLIAEDLAGRDVSLTIEKIVIEDRPTDTGPEPMPTLYFEEMTRKKSKKRLGLNVTNARAIGKLHGPEATGWVGKRVTIFPTTCDAFGERVTCIRVRPGSPNARHPGPPPELDYDPSSGEVPPDQEPTDEELGLNRDGE